MEHKTGNLFDTESKVLGHGVNCQGLMGAGIAKTFKAVFPKNYEQYRDACSETVLAPARLLPGRSLIVPEGGLYIVNMATQWRPGRDARYTWLHLAVRDAMMRLVDLGLRGMAIPEIGCGIGGLEWAQVERILLELEQEFTGGWGSFEFEVWHYEA